MEARQKDNVSCKIRSSRVGPESCRVSSGELSEAAKSRGPEVQKPSTETEALKVNAAQNSAAAREVKRRLDRREARPKVSWGVELESASQWLAGSSVDRNRQSKG